MQCPIIIGNDINYNNCTLILIKNIIIIIIITTIGLLILIVVIIAVIILESKRLVCERVCERVESNGSR